MHPALSNRRNNVHRPQPKNRHPGPERPLLLANVHPANTGRVTRWQQATSRFVSPVFANSHSQRIQLLPKQCGFSSKSGVSRHRPTSGAVAFLSHRSGHERRRCDRRAARSLAASHHGDSCDSRTLLVVSLTIARPGFNSRLPCAGVRAITRCASAGCGRVSRRRGPAPAT